MFRRTSSTLLGAVAALALTLAAAGGAHAQVSGTFRVEFGRLPHWDVVSGTRVEEIRTEEAPDYDIFRYNNHYYVYNGGNWYWSDQPTGSYVVLDEQSVPVEIHRVPREHWHSYPADWDNDSGTSNDNTYNNSYNNDRDRDRYATRSRDDRSASMTFTVDFRRRPHFVPISGTSVMEVEGPEAPDYDIFRYHGTYYVYDEGRWYRSDHWRGTFSFIDASEVPTAFTKIPRNRWRTYPADWPAARHHHRSRY